MKLDVERCQRHKIQINGENFYLVIGKTFVCCTVPDENKAKTLLLRKIVDELCENISGIMEEKENSDDNHK